PASDIRRCRTDLQWAAAGAPAGRIRRRREQAAFWPDRTCPRTSDSKTVPTDCTPPVAWSVISVLHGGTGRHGEHPAAGFHGMEGVWLPPLKLKEEARIGHEKKPNREPTCRFHRPIIEVTFVEFRLPSVSRFRYGCPGGSARSDDRLRSRRLELRLPDLQTPGPCRRHHPGHVSESLSPSVDVPRPVFRQDVAAFHCAKHRL